MTKRISIKSKKGRKKEGKKMEKKTFKIMGISIWRILAYFIIYSFFGYIIETIFGIVTKGVWESRQSFLYGPFCAIYGLGACIMIIFLYKYGKKYNALFLGGFIVGSIIEYLVSWIGEMILGVKWWDYSDMPLNINGRVCVYFSLFWGFLSIYLMASLNPKIDKLINWIKSKFTIKTLKISTIVVTIFLFIDCILTAFALDFFLVRMIYANDIQVPNKEKIDSQYVSIYEENENLSKFIYKFWDNRKMIKTFPNIKVQDVDGNILYMDSYLDIQPYYMKIFSKKE